MKRVAFVSGIVVAFVLVLLAGWRLNSWRQGEEEKRLRRIHTLTGTVKQYPHFASEHLGGERRVWVYLPPGYEEQAELRYPVLYMHDGQNVFDGATAFHAGMEWEADETAERLIEEGRIEPLIIVAVDNGGEKRTDEYTPTRARGGGGEVGRHARMLVEELKPWVDREFRTRAGREGTGILGSSFGGLASLWTGLTYPDVFGGIAALSPSAGRDDDQIIRFVKDLSKKPATRVWIDMSTAEGSGAVRAARRLRDALVEKGWTQGEDLRYLEAEGASHDEAAWARRLPAILEFLFPPPAEKPADS